MTGARSDCVAAEPEKRYAQLCRDVPETDEICQMSPIFSKLRPPSGKIHGIGEKLTLCGKSNSSEHDSTKNDKKQPIFTGII